MFGQTPLHIAFMNNHKELIKLLIEFGANLDIKDKNNLRPEDLEFNI